MNVELTQSDVAMVKEALDAWEKEVVNSSLMGSMMTGLLGCMIPKDERREVMDDWKSEELSKKRQAEVEGQRRKDQATLLRAKLIQASAKASEHEEVEDANH